jgi:hypothetical protein
MSWMEGHQYKAWRSGDRAATVTQTATVHVVKYYFSLADKGLFLLGVQGKQPECIEPMA